MSVAVITTLYVAQAFTQRGFIETPLFVYPQTVPGDSGRVVAEALFRWEGAYRVSPEWKFNFGFDAQTDTHRQTARDGQFSFFDRTRPRPMFAARRVSVVYTKRRWTVEAGKQFIRWGRTDVLTPTDRFAPRDYANVARTEFLPVTAVRTTWSGDKDTFDAVYVPRFTPSRTPLLNQRWAGPVAASDFRDFPANSPGAGQFGVRWSRQSRFAEHSIAFFEGFNHLPLVEARFEGRFVSPPQPQTFPATTIVDTPIVRIERGFAQFFPRMRMIGGDLSVPTKWLTIKSEAAYFASNNRRADEYWLYVIEAERQWGEWLAVVGYAGETITNRRVTADFAPDRGLTRSIVSRISYTIDARRSVAAESAIRQNGDGALVRLEYSQAAGAHWRATGGIVFIRGAATDFLGQFRRNSYGFLTLRYSF